jgi:hypothetical protein
MRVGAPENLFDWNYWLTTWPAEPVLLTRANAADGYPRALTPLSQDLILPFEDAGVRRFFEETLGAMRPSDAPLPYLCALWGHVYINADQLANLGAVMPGSSRQSIYQQYMGLNPDPDFRPESRSVGARLGALRTVGPVLAGMLSAARTARERFAAQAAEVRALRPAGVPGERECLAWLLGLESLMTAAWESLMIGPGIASATFEVSEKVIAKATGRPAADLNNRLHVGLGGNESAEAGRMVGRLATLARANPALAEAVAADAPGSASWTRRSAASWPPGWSGSASTPLPSSSWPSPPGASNPASCSPWWPASCSVPPRSAPPTTVPPRCGGRLRPSWPRGCAARYARSWAGYFGCRGARWRCGRTPRCPSC